MPTATVPEAVRLAPDELAWLLALRPTPAATLVGAALGAAAGDRDRAPSTLIERGLAGERRGELLPRGDAVVIGDALTSARALVSVGDAVATAAVLVVAPERVLMVAAGGSEGVEVVGLDASVGVGEAAAAIAARVGPGAVVMVAVPDGDITSVTGPDIGAAVETLLP
jgi:hypothetical protein